jgi:hypothetical protein
MWMLHNETITWECLCECYIKWNDNTEMFMWMLHNEMIMEIFMWMLHMLHNLDYYMKMFMWMLHIKIIWKCLCECYMKRNDNIEMFICECYKVRCKMII